VCYGGYVDALVKALDCDDDAATLVEPPQGLVPISVHLRMEWHAANPMAGERRTHGVELTQVLAVDDPSLAWLELGGKDCHS
jgi:hypothetical protein